MIARERVRRALAFQEPDRLPIDNNGIVSSIHEVTYRNLLNYLGLSEPIVILDPVQRIVLASEQVLDRLGVDTRYLYPNAPEGWEYREDEQGRWRDEFGAVYQRVGFYADCVTPPLKGKSYVEVKAYRFPDPTDPARFAGLGDKAAHLYRSTGFALASGSMICLDYIRWIVRGLEDSILDTGENSPVQDYLLDSITEWMMAFGGELVQELGERIEFFWVGDDWGAQAGPFYSPETFRRVFKPRLARLIAHLKSRTRAKCAYHCCGSVRWALEDLIDIGVDILHPLQPNARGNEDTAGIKRQAAGRIGFHGGTNNQGLFHDGLRELELDTLGRIRDLAPGGGYIFSSGHNIQANMPPESLLALFRLAREFGGYPIDARRIEGEIERLERGGKP
jgi:uroporphyrinogen decarboxylase